MIPKIQSSLYSLPGLETVNSGHSVLWIQSPAGSLRCLHWFRHNNCSYCAMVDRGTLRPRPFWIAPYVCVLIAILTSCGEVKNPAPAAGDSSSPEISVGVAKAYRKNVAQT